MEPQNLECEGGSFEKKQLPKGTGKPLGEHIDSFCLLCVAFADNLEFTEEQWNHIEHCEACFGTWKHLIDEFREREDTLN